MLDVSIFIPNRSRPTHKEVQCKGKAPIKSNQLAVLLTVSHYVY